MAKPLNMIYISCVVIFIIATIVINVINCIALRQGLKRLKTDCDLDSQSSIDTFTKINIATKRIMIFPIISAMMWIVLYLDRFTRVIDKLIGKDINYLDKYYLKLVGGISAISNGMRALLFSVLFIYTSSELQTILKHLFIKNTKEQIIAEDKISLSNQSFL